MKKNDFGRAFREIERMKQKSREEIFSEAEAILENQVVLLSVDEFWLIREAYREDFDMLMHERGVEIIKRQKFERNIVLGLGMISIPFFAIGF